MKDQAIACAIHQWHVQTGGLPQIISIHFPLLTQAAKTTGELALGCTVPHWLPGLGVCGDFVSGLCCSQIVNLILSYVRAYLQKNRTNGIRHDVMLP